MRPISALSALALLAGPSANLDATAAEPDWRALLERVERLEARNGELERRLAEAIGGTVAAAAREAVVSSRIEDVEHEVLTLRRQTGPLDAVQGIGAAAALTMVAQQTVQGGVGVRRETALNYRGDVEVTLPVGAVGDAQGELFTHFRVGQGDGSASLPPTLTGAVNSTTFRLVDADDSAAILAQAWYRLNIPLGDGLRRGLAHVELVAGKVDPFVFFDQNGVADDESEAFLNNVFVHNPLLDSGGDVGVDAYGFSPGVRVAYFDEGLGVGRWGASGGVFGAGPSASFGAGLARPFVIGQVEYSGPAWNDRDAAFRFYAWSNGQATAFANPVDVASERHSGWGLSLNQEVTDHLALFVRHGRSTTGRVRFDRAFTVGLRSDGAAWGRPQDHLGLAAGWLRVSDAFRSDAPRLDADGDGQPDFGFAPTGAERQYELYYAWQVDDHLHIAPSVQRIVRPGGDAGASEITLVGLRAKLAY